MLDKDGNFWNELNQFFFKIFIPAFSGISIKIATIMTKEKVTVLRAILSYIIGILMAYVCSPIVEDLTTTKYYSVAIAVIAISGEKVAEYIIYKWNIDVVLTNLAGLFTDFITNLMGMGRVFKNLFSTAIGLALVGSSVYYDLSDIIRFVLIVFGIGLIFSRDTLIKKMFSFLDKYISPK